jgi:hypothetical protein
VFFKGSPQLLGYHMKFFGIGWQDNEPLAKQTNVVF